MILLVKLVNKFSRKMYYVFTEYLSPRNPYFGSTIGRTTNIICDGTMVVRPSGRIYMLSTNKGHHHYHGGYIGFDKVRLQ